MKVLHVIPAVAPRYGGPSQVLVAMARALVARGVDILVATTDADGDTRLPVRLGIKEEYCRTPMIFFGRQHGEGFKYSPGLAQWLASTILEFDVVHIHAVFSYSSFAAAAACRRVGKPYLLRPLGSLDPWSLRQNALRKWVLLAFGARKMLAHAAAVHFTTVEEQQLALARFPWLRGVVIPLGLEPAAFEAPVVPARVREPIVLALTRLHRKKNLEGLIEAFGRVVAQGPAETWRLVIAGSGEQAYRRQLERCSRNAGIADRTDFPGWVEGGAKAALFGRASLFALPSYQENFGLAVLEAMAAGLPAIVTQGVNIASEIKTAGAGWVVPNEAAALDAALRAAITSAEERERRGVAARRLAERYRWPAIAESLERLYRDILAGAGRTVPGREQPAVEAALRSGGH